MKEDYVELTFKDKGDFLRGLLILIGKDNNIHEKERKAILEIGLRLGFEKKFCVDAVNDFLSNQYIDKSSPKFSGIEIAKYFLEQAFHVAKVDKDLHVAEIKWLSEVAKKNHVNNSWFRNKFLEFSSPSEELHNNQ